MTVVAHYYKYHRQYDAEFDTFDAAIGFLAMGEEYGELTGDYVTDGERTIEHSALGELIDDYGTDCYKSQDWIDADAEEITEQHSLPERTYGPGWPE